MIDTTIETMVLLVRAGRIVNPSQPPHSTTLWRWATRGIRGGIRLETVLIGATRWTSREAIARFLVNLNTPGAVPKPPNRAAERAGEALAARGA